MPPVTLPPHPPAAPIVEAPASAWPARWADVAAPLAYLGLTFVLLNRVWDDPNGWMLADNEQDQSQFEWILAHAPRSFTLWGANYRSGL